MEYLHQNALNDNMTKSYFSLTNQCRKYFMDLLNVDKMYLKFWQQCCTGAQ